MTDELPTEFAVVCDDQPDLRMAARLADRVLCAVPRLDWLEDGGLDSVREWRGVPGSVHPEFVKWSAVGSLFDAAKLHARHGHFDGKKGWPYAHQAHKAILLLVRTRPAPHAIVLALDSDDDDKRLLGLRQARDSFPAPDRDRIVIAFVKTKRECWLLAGFDPVNDEERELLGEVKSECGFDPVAESQMLTATSSSHGAKRNAKRVFSALTRGDAQRAEACLETDLAKLETRGRGNGLAEYFEEVRSRLAPLLIGTVSRIGHVERR